MVNNLEERDFHHAVADFRSARRQASLKDLIARLKGEPTQLLSFNQVWKALDLYGGSDRGLRDIPLNSVVGSVGRYTDFTRDFLPRSHVNEQRWARVKVAASGLVGLPPIYVYQIGEAYFVQDGNHRVSVARQLGASHIQAYVTEVNSRVPITPDTKPDDLIIIAEYSDFLESTQLDKFRPGADLKVSIPGQYQILLIHIKAHKLFMERDLDRGVPLVEAAIHWYDSVYFPVVKIIRSRGILRDFSGRTETDLYLWIARHRSHLEEQLGWDIQTEYAASDLVDHYSPATEKVLERIGEKILHIVVPDTLEPGPPTGKWRKEILAERRKGHLLVEILVPINGRDDGWCALEQALVIAQRGKTHIHGLHIVSSEAEIEQGSALAVRSEFEGRCKNAGADGNLLITTGGISTEICHHAVWSDLVVINLTYPPGKKPLARLGSGFRALIQRCPRPILATPQTVSPLSKALLSYDGSPKASEAMYVATYLAGRWRIPLVVLAVRDRERVTENTLKQAQDYLTAHGVEATYIIQDGPIADRILLTSEEHQCDLLFLGGYGLNPVLEMVIGSTVDQVLRESRKPIFICR